MGLLGRWGYIYICFTLTTDLPRLAALGGLSWNAAAVWQYSKVQICLSDGTCWSSIVCNVLPVVNASSSTKLLATHVCSIFSCIVTFCHTLRPIGLVSLSFMAFRCITSTAHWQNRSHRSIAQTSNQQMTALCKICDCTSASSIQWEQKSSI